jgi:hypothetical protein
MFMLLVVACVGLNTCEQVAPPLSYASEERCRGQAAIVAGMIKANYHWSESLIYRFRCDADGMADPEEAWTWVLPGGRRVAAGSAG